MKKAFIININSKIISRAILLVVFGFGLAGAPSFWLAKNSRSSRKADTL